jgi:hypothetical protein
MKITKGIFTLLCSFIAAAVIIAIGCVIMNESSKTVLHGGLSGKYTAEAENAAPTVSNTDKKYLMCDYHGDIGIFDLDGNLIKTLNVATVTLPIAEREKLSVGFYIDSDTELQKIIEDYTG